MQLSTFLLEVNIGRCSFLCPVMSKDLLSQFEGFKLVFQPRDGNRVAGRIANKSLSFLNYDPKLYSIVPN